MDIVQEVLEKTAKEAEKYKPITVEKHLDLELDLGHLLAIDPNELDVKALKSQENDYLSSLTRENVQLLLNKIWDLPTERVEEALVVKLPEPKFILPRSKPVPKPRPLTRWQQFAKEKGIVKKKKDKLSWDEQLQKWIPNYGYKRAAAQKEKEWLLEVPQNSDPLEDQFAKKSAEKEERVAKNELQRLRNVAKAKNIKVPRLGITSTDAASSKELNAAVTIAKSATASFGKFQQKLPKEKIARGINAIVPGTVRKRKPPPISATQEKSENLTVIDSILNKKPKIDIDKAVARHINEEQIQQSEENQQRKKPKAGSKGKKMGKSRGAKKPIGGKGKRLKGKGNLGRKRR